MVTVSSVEVPRKFYRRRALSPRKVASPVSQFRSPGYGSTEVTAGAVEQITRQVVKDGLSAARQLSWVDKQRLVFYGESRGAIVAAALANELEDVRGTVLYSGAYDLGTLYRETPSTWVRKILNPNGEAKPEVDEPFVRSITVAHANADPAR